MRFMRCLVAVFGLVLGLSAFAGEKFDAAMEAYNAGNYRLAYKMLKPLAKDGGPRAQFILGGMYIEGLGVEADTKEGVYWLEQAVERQHREAAITLGKMYLSGRGVPLDPEKGSYYMRLAESFESDEPPEDECD